jgi:hypothetical protein
MNMKTTGFLAELYKAAASTDGQYRSLGSMGEGRIQTQSGFQIDVRNVLVSNGVSPETATKLAHSPLVSDSWARGLNAQAAAKKVAASASKLNNAKSNRRSHKSISRAKFNNKQEFAFLMLEHVEQQIARANKLGANYYGGRVAFHNELRRLRKEYREYFRQVFGKES